MNEIDLYASVQISAEPTDVAAVMFDPSREPEWAKAVTAVELLDRALVPGARVRRRGSFLGREFSWITSVETVAFPHLLVLTVAEGPFEGTVRYQVQRAGDGTQARIKLNGTVPALGSMPSALFEHPLRAAIESDLARLKEIVEAAVATAQG
jgi:uncharacterized membrane protein